MFILRASPTAAKSFTFNRKSQIFAAHCLFFIIIRRVISKVYATIKLFIYEQTLRLMPEELEQFMDEGFQVFEQFHGSA